MPLIKYVDWPQRVATTLEAARERPFVWGEFDCCLFAADVIAAQTGTDLAKELRGRYRTELGAARVLKKAGGIEALLDAHFSRVPPGMAQRGDVLLFDGEQGPTLGVFFGQIWATTQQGVAVVSVEPLIVWRVE